MNIGYRIVAARTALGWKQRQLAELLEARNVMTQQTLSALETGKAKGTTKVLELAEALGVNPQWLQTGEGPMWLADASGQEIPSALVPLFIRLAELDRQQRLTPELVAALMAVAELATVSP